jgi:hypothetical protein
MAMGGKRTWGENISKIVGTKIVPGFLPVIGQRSW